MTQRKFYFFHLLGISLLLMFVLLQLFYATESNLLASSWNSLFNFDATNIDQVIFRELRFPRVVTAIVAGASLSVAGYLMQTLFQNPLAGPSVLGISSGSSLFVALLMLGGVTTFAGSSIFTDVGIVGMALLGALVYSLIILAFSSFVKNHVSLLLVGIMLGGFTNAVIQVIQITTNANELKSFTLWGFGSVQQVNFEQLLPLLTWIFLSFFLLIFLIKPLKIITLGEVASINLGLKLKRIRIFIIVVTALLTGIVTAYCGPISFIGLAVPNVVKVMYKTQNQTHLILGCIIFGAVLLLFCDFMILLFEPYFMLPLNGITALLGSPIVVWIILKRF
jgi:iron complex transport system permease protein